MANLGEKEKVYELVPLEEPVPAPDQEAPLPTEVPEEEPEHVGD